jgi:hypothetical protein
MSSLDASVAPNRKHYRRFVLPIITIVLISIHTFCGCQYRVDFGAWFRNAWCGLDSWGNYPETKEGRNGSGDGQAAGYRVAV